MKRKLQFISLLFLIGFSIHAKNGLGIITDPNANATISGSTTICPGNVAVLTINGTPNCIVRIDNPLVSPYSSFISIGATGTAVFTTPILNSTVTYTLISISEFSTGIVTSLTGSATINVVPNGCTTVLTNSPAGPNSLISCTPGECRTLIATPTTVPSTASYTVSSIPYCPQAAFVGFGNTLIDANNDDVWSPSIALPFNFSFFDQNYTSCQVGSNGLISFNPQASPGFCNWNLYDLNFPNTDTRTPKNAILGVFQDIDFRTVGGQSPAEVSINWTLTGTYPCRKLIVNFYHVGQFNCNQTNGLQTSQIVLYEISNIIEVYVQNRTQCLAWEDGDGVIGITNSSGTLGYIPAGRNTNDAWTTTNEAWRFTPSGPNVTSFVRWLEGSTEIASGLNATVCPTQTTSYTAEATYIISGVPFTVTGTSTVIVAADETQSPADLSVCYDASGSYTVDLTANNTTIIGAANPNDIEIYYFTSLTDAQNVANPIMNPTTFSFTQDQTIYAVVMNVNYDCYYIKPFQLTILTAVGAPIGISPQTLNEGQPLSSLIVSGQNIQWYDAPQDGNLLPNSTIAQNNVTYYASQMVNNCESRTSLSARLAILVQLNLANDQFESNAFNFFPNPTSDILTLTSNLADVKLDIFNTLSQKIESRTLQSGANTINLSNLAQGVYLFQLSLEGKNKTYKIVKN
jgi:hypothetical protein